MCHFKDVVVRRVNTGMDRHKHDRRRRSLYHHPPSHFHFEEKVELVSFASEVRAREVRVRNFLFRPYLNDMF